MNENQTVGKRQEILAAAPSLEGGHAPEKGPNSWSKIKRVREG